MSRFVTVYVCMSVSDVARWRTLSYGAVRLIAPLNCWQNSTPFWCKASFSTIRIDHFRALNNMARAYLTLFILVVIFFIPEKSSNQLASLSFFGSSLLARLILIVNFNRTEAGLTSKGGRILPAVQWCYQNQFICPPWQRTASHETTVEYSVWG